MTPMLPSILVVDDDPGVRSSLKLVLQNHYRAMLASDPYEALALVRQFRVQVAIVDIRMPGMSGIELLARLKEVDPMVEVIMLTAYESFETAREALRHGACDYLTKPFSVVAIREAVERALRRRALADEVRIKQQTLQRLKQEVDQARLQGEIARAKGEIYASVIHDLNNPLTVIAGLIELINCRTGELGPASMQDQAALRESLDQISRQVASCTQISRRYLTFLRQRTAADARVAANQTLVDLQALLKNHRAHRNNELVLEPLAEDLVVRINGTDLIQVLLNLVINAFQVASTPVKVRVSVSRVDDPATCFPAKSGPCEVVVADLSLLTAGPHVRFDVQDNAGGIPEAVVTRIFEPYFTMRSSGEGSGLGLAIVSRLVNAARGAIHLRTEPGRGSCFSVYLPVV